MASETIINVLKGQATGSLLKTSCLSSILIIVSRWVDAAIPCVREAPNGSSWTSDLNTITSVLQKSQRPEKSTSRSWHKRSSCHPVQGTRSRIKQTITLRLS